MSALISACGTYRWRLDRPNLRVGPAVAIFGVNPSTADAVVNDATIRRDLGFAELLGWGHLIKLNKFAFRAKEVKDLRALTLAEAVGAQNDDHIRDALREAEIVIYAWGPLAKLPERLRKRWLKVHEIVVNAGHKPLCFGIAKDGHPRHTLMLSYETPLQNWTHP